MPKEEALSQFLKRVKSSLSFQSSFPEIKESVITEMVRVLFICLLNFAITLN